MNWQVTEIRDSLISMTEDPLYGFGATVISHAHDSMKDAATFVFEMPDGNVYEVEVTKLHPRNTITKR